MQKADKESFSFLDLISNLAGSAILLGAFLYICGWTYLYQYYRSFGLELSDVDISSYDALIYSLRVIFSSNTLYGVFIFLFIIGVGLIFQIRWVRTKLPVAFSLILIGILFSSYKLSRLGANLGNENARSDMMAETSNLPTAAIQVSSDGSQMIKDDAAKLDKLEFKLLAHKKGQYFIFRPLDGKSIEEGISIDLIVVPESHVQQIRLQRGVK